MRAAFVNNLHGTYGADAVNAQTFTDKVTRYGLQRLWFIANDPDGKGATPQEMATLRKRGLGPGAMRDPNWDGLGPVSLANAQLEDITTYAPHGETLSLIGDIEQPHDPNYIIAWYLYLRPRIEPWRWIVWTFEAGQGGWFSRDLVSLINSDPTFYLFPFQYLDGATDWGTVKQVRADITSRGVNPAQVKIVQRGGELTPATFPDGAAWTLDEGAPWGLS